MSIIVLRADLSVKDVVKIVESLLIALTLCIDAFAIGLSYGIKEIKFSKISILIISFVSICVLAVAMLVGNILEKLLSNNLTTVLSFLILVGLGCSYIIEGYIKQVIVKRKEMKDKQLANIKVSKLGIVVNISLDDMTTDQCNLNNVTYKEALYLGVALSLDSLGIGLGSAMGNMNYLQIISFAFILSLLSIPLGISLGKKFKLYNENIKTFWISGTILIVLGISKLT